MADHRYAAGYDSSGYEIVAEVIRQAGKEKPADAALREVLKSLRDLRAFDATESPDGFSLLRCMSGCAMNAAWRPNAARPAVERRFRKTKPASRWPNCAPGGSAVTAEVMDVNDDWLRSLQREPKLWLRAKRGRAEWLAEKLSGAEVSPLCRMPGVRTAKRICSDAGIHGAI